MFPVRGFVVVLISLAVLSPLAAARDYSPFLETDVPIPHAEAMPPELAALNETVDGARMWDDDEELCMDPSRPNRVTGTPLRDNARDWVFSKYEQEGYAPVIQEFDSTIYSPGAIRSANPAPALGYNVLAWYPGSDLTRWVVVGGHYDSLPTTGCLDNAAGTITALEIARAFMLTKPNLTATVVFAGWDAEEIGLFGSSAFVEDASVLKEAMGLDETTNVTILAGLSYDMNGLNWPARNPFPTYYGGELAMLNLRTSPVEHRNYYERGETDKYSEEQLLNFSRFQAIVKKAVFGYLAYDPEFVKVFDDNYGRSDHSPFISAGMPGLRLQGAHEHGEPGSGAAFSLSEYPPYHNYLDNSRFLEQYVGRDQIEAGLDSSATVGAVVLAMVALTGDYAAAMDDVPRGGETDKNDRGVQLDPAVPGFELVLVAGAVGIVLLRRRR